MNKTSWIHRDGCDKRVQVMPAMPDEVPAKYYIPPPPPVAEPYNVSGPVGRWSVRPTRRSTGQWWR